MRNIERTSRLIDRLLGIMLCPLFIVIYLPLAVIANLTKRYM